MRSIVLSCLAFVVIFHLVSSSPNVDSASDLRTGAEEDDKIDRLLDAIEKTLHDSSSRLNQIDRRVQEKSWTGASTKGLYQIGRRVQGKWGTGASREGLYQIGRRVQGKWGTGASREAVVTPNKDKARERDLERLLGELFGENEE